MQWEWLTLIGRIPSGETDSGTYFSLPVLWQAMLAHWQLVCMAFSAFSPYSRTQVQRFPQRRGMLALTARLLSLPYPDVSKTYGGI